MSWGVSPWFYPVWDSLGFLDLGNYFLPHFREVFNYYLLKYFLMAFLFVFFFWDSYDSNVGAFNIVPEVSEVVLISIFFSFLLSASFISIILSSTSLILSSASVILLLVPSRVFFYLIYCIIHYWLTLLFLLGPCEIFLASSQPLSLVYLSVTPFCFQDFGSLSYHSSKFFFR